MQRCVSLPGSTSGGSPGSAPARRPPRDSHRSAAPAAACARWRALPAPQPPASTHHADRPAHRKVRTSQSVPESKPVNDGIGHVRMTRRITPDGHEPTPRPQVHGIVARRAGLPSRRSGVRIFPGAPKWLRGPRLVGAGMDTPRELLRRWASCISSRATSLRPSVGSPRTKRTSPWRCGWGRVSATSLRCLCPRGRERRISTQRPGGTLGGPWT